MSKDLAYIENYVASLPIPGDSPSISGIFLEQIIPGYRTHETTGRWSLYTSLKETANVGDYARYNNKRYEPRDFIVHYYITCDSPENLHNSTRKLKSFLHQNRKEFKLIFHDDPDIYYVGIVGNVEVDRLVNRCSVSGSFTIHCSDGRGFSVKEYEVTPIQTEGMLILNVEYNGTKEAYPILEAKTRNSAGTGFIGFLNDEGKIIQIGDPKAELNAGENVVNKDFANANTTGWTRNAYTPKPDGTERTFTSTGTVKASGVGLTIDGAGSGSNNHGPCLSLDFSSNSAENFNAEMQYVLNMTAGSTNVAGGLEFIIVGHDDGSAVEYEIARISIYKKDNKTSASKIDCWVDGKIVDSKEFKMDDKNSNFYTGSATKIDK